MKSSTPERGSGLELWGGVECSVVRLGDTVRDQVAETGHRDRPDDLQAIAALGIRTLRYPVVWETVAPDHPDECRWGWHDRQLSHLRRLGIRPIAGLVHHGGGPRYTNLLDPAFPELLARHAGRVAERYPWIEAFTPVNEPMTTARFSALYGHWFPHAADLGSFLRALAIQCRAVVLAMRAIRRVNPGAKLVQTEDLGRTFSTPALRYQARHENERRWLSLDLLCGRVDREHPWRRVFLDHGVGEAELDLFLDGDAAPDVVGINHYLTSERFLDERHDRYPADTLGGNGRHVYADAEAVRMHLPAHPLGPKARLQEAWLRYGRPLAVTEAHHGCSREEQLRWLMEVWTAAAELKDGGADIRAVTVWGLFGAVDWRSLLRRYEGHYDPGAFEIRAPAPRRTAVGRAAAALAASGTFTHPVLDRPGWWRRPERFYHPTEAPAGPVPRCRPVLIVGGEALGAEFARICAQRGLDHARLRRHEMDGADPASTALALDRLRPWAVIDATGGPTDAEPGPTPHRVAEAARRALALSGACAERGLPLLTVSSHRVFDGELRRAYVESDPVSPACRSGQSDAEAERVAAEHPGALIVRGGPLFGFADGGDWAARALRRMTERGALRLPGGVVSPTYAPDLVHAALDLLLDEEAGVWHLANDGSTTWDDFADELAAAAGLSRPRGPREVGAGPVTALTSERQSLMPTLDSAVRRFARERAETCRAGAGLEAAE